MTAEISPKLNGRSTFAKTNDNRFGTANYYFRVGEALSILTLGFIVKRLPSISPKI